MALRANYTHGGATTLGSIESILIMIVLNVLWTMHAEDDLKRLSYTQ